MKERRGKSTHCNAQVRARCGLTVPEAAPESRGEAAATVGATTGKVGRPDKELRLRYGVDKEAIPTRGFFLVSQSVSH